MKIAFGEEREKGEKTRVGYIQGDAGFESETRESKRRNRVAGTADARNSVASPRCHNARLGACV